MFCKPFPRQDPSVCPRKRLSFFFCRLFGYILCRQKTKATRICLTVGFTHFMFYSLFTTYCNFHISLVFFIRTNFQLFAFFFCLNSIYSLPRTAFISFIFLLSFIHFCHLFSFLLRSGRPNHRGEVCSAHVTIRSSPLPLLLSTIALQSILPPFNSTCNQLYALQRAVRIERAAPGHPARPPQLQRTSPPERASSWLPAPLRLYSSGVYKSSTSTAQQCRAVPFSSAAPQRTLPLQHRSFP